MKLQWIVCTFYIVYCVSEPPTKSSSAPASPGVCVHHVENEKVEIFEKCFGDFPTLFRHTHNVSGMNEATERSKKKRLGKKWEKVEWGRDFPSTVLSSCVRMSFCGFFAHSLTRRGCVWLGRNFSLQSSSPLSHYRTAPIRPTPNAH